MKPKPNPLNFWRHCQQDKNGCWLWTGSTDTKGGYGKFVWKLHGNRYAARAHRVAWWLARGEWPGKWFVCHSCDVPHCVNPGHLWLGTNQDNMRDAWAKGRIRLPNHKHRECWDKMLEEKETTDITYKELGPKYGYSVSGAIKIVKRMREKG